jgi:hypothetical protein
MVYRLGSRGSILGRKRDTSVLYSIQTGFMAHLPFYPKLILVFHRV